MFSVLLELPEYEVVNQEIYSSHNIMYVDKRTDEERCPHCGFLSSLIYDKRTRK
ncbi:hypothetical protein JOD45_000168 [Scopulibacillus daqui]|uniref:Transposase IS204/IS1001/IS1096/IS1165 family protein n=1 Tax=Scopulibacillus daqui TaxID=1469162 RepID=A0ABS2PV95_9BACL|nr:hypothetical protein [Scopulibacillus daqui]